MKKNLSILFIFLGLLSAMKSNANVASPNYIVWDDILPRVVPDVYMNATSVDIELILRDGSTFARATTSAGNGVTFNIGGAPVTRVRTTYHVNLVEYIIDEIVVPE